MKDLTDWKRVDAMTEEDIERAAASDPDAPMTTAADWVNATIVWPRKKEPVTIRIDKDVLNWFRERGRGYQSRINAVLRAFVEAQKKAAQSSSQRPPLGARRMLRPARPPGASMEVERRQIRPSCHRISIAAPMRSS